MTLLLAFALTLVAAVLVSERASRTILSTSVVFLGVGVVLGATMLPVRGDDERVHTLVELALVVVLFTEGISLAIARPAREWRLPARALALGMPFTVIATALLAHGVASLPWHAAWLVGAALAPTDRVFASALVGREGVPHRVRHLLNVESGINDGLALPLVAALLAASGERGDTAATALGRAVGGAVTGAAVAWLVVRLEALRAFGASERYRAIGGLAVGVLVYAIARSWALNEFLAAFTAGVALSAVSAPMGEAFKPLGDLIAEVIKLAAILLFGALLAYEVGSVDRRDLAFVAAALLAVRPPALLLSLSATPLPWRERIAVAWFGPKGFASIFFGVMILRTAGGEADRVFRLIALVVAASIVVHSSSDVVVARALERRSR